MLISLNPGGHNLCRKSLWVKKPEEASSLAFMAGIRVSGIVSKKMKGRHCRPCPLKLSSSFLFPSLSLISQSRQLGAIGNGTGWKWHGSRTPPPNNIQHSTSDATVHQNGRIESAGQMRDAELHAEPRANTYHDEGRSFPKAKPSRGLTLRNAF